MDYGRVSLLQNYETSNADSVCSGQVGAHVCPLVGTIAEGTAQHFRAMSIVALIDLHQQQLACTPCPSSIGAFILSDLAKLFYFVELTLLEN